jgi:hypothetical protein
MKTLFLAKVLLLLPSLLFVSLVFMIVLGIIGSIFGFGDEFYCGPFYLAGKIILGLTVVTFLFLILPDIKMIFNIHQNVTSKEE